MGLRQAMLVVVAALMLSGCAVESEIGLPPRGCPDLSREVDGWRPGCATHRNMVAVAADPRDLRRARAEAPRDAMRRDAVIAAYAGKRAAGEPVAAMADGAASEKGGSR
jgi:type IV pilus biogenesis protein CpaD/CtpE